MRIPMNLNRAGLKPYTINLVGDTDAEINLYGEVVQSHPTDFWTGEKIAGNFICLDEFMAELDTLAGKQNITVHINSVGGDFFAGLSIYNRLRSLNASVTTINDSLAASAGSIIFLAGDKGKRQVYAGSNLMVHGVLSFFFGYYNVPDLKGYIKTMESFNKTLAAVYVEATGLPEDTIKAAISKDTYMTGQEAVDNGWADEVISGDGNALVNLALSPDSKYLMANGMAVAARCFGKLPENIRQMSAEEWSARGEEPPANGMQPAPQADIKTIQNGGKDMEINSVEELRNAFPEFVAQVEAAARNEGSLAERARIQGIDAIASAIGDAEMVHNAKFGEKPLSAQDLAFAVMQKQANIGATMLNQLEDDSKASGAADVVPAAGGNQEVDPESPEAVMAQAKADMAKFQNMNKKEVR